MSKRRRYLDDNPPTVLPVNSEGLPYYNLPDIDVNATRLPKAKATDSNIQRYANAIDKGQIKLTQIPDTELRNRVRAKPIVDKIIEDRDKAALPILGATVGMPASIIGGISAAPTVAAIMNNPIVNAGLTVHGAITAPKNIKEGIEEIKNNNVGRGALDLGLTVLDLYGAGKLIKNGRNTLNKVKWLYNNGNIFNADAVFRPEHFHRHVGQEAIKDAKETGVIRGNPLGGRSNNVPFFMKDRGNLFITQDEFPNPSDVIEGTINSADDWVDAWRISSRRRYLDERSNEIQSILESDDVSKSIGFEGLPKEKIDDLLLEKDFIDDINTHPIRSINDPIVTTDRAKQYVSTHKISEFGDEFTPYTSGKFEAPTDNFTYWRKYPVIGWRENSFKDEHKFFDFLRNNFDVKVNKKRSLKHGGIYIKPSHRGRFTALKERTGHSATWFKENGTPAQKKMATFALNAAKWNH